MELVRQSHPAIFVELPERIVGDLPHMSIRIGKVAVAAAPESLASLLENAPSGGFVARHHGIDVVLACQILGNGDAAVAGPKLSGLRVVPLGIAAPHREHHRACLEEAHACLTCSFGPDESERLIEGRGPGDVCYVKSDQANMSRRIQ